MVEYRQSSSGNDTVATAPKLWRPIADKIGGFDLDPAAGCEPAPIATKRYTKDEDGLTQAWHGNVWLNPPFSEKRPWYKRAVNQYKNGDVDRLVALAPGDVSTDWFHNWFSTADALVFLNGRDWYISPGKCPTFSTQIGLWNPTNDLMDYLHTIGTVVEPRETNQQQTLL